MPTHTEEKEKLQPRWWIPTTWSVREGQTSNSGKQIQQGRLPHQEPTENGVKGLFPASLAATTNVVRI